VIPTKKKYRSIVSLGEQRQLAAMVAWRWDAGGKKPDESWEDYFPVFSYFRIISRRLLAAVKLDARL
jgi:hypothetical protein